MSSETTSTAPSKKNESDELTVKAASVVASLIDTCDIALDSRSSACKENSTSSISMTPLIESMRSCYISSDSPVTCVDDDHMDNKMTKRILFTIPEKNLVTKKNEFKVQEEEITMSTPPPPPSPPSHSWSDEKKMKLSIDVESNAKNTDTKTHSSSGPKFENGRWIWDDDDEKNIKSNPASVPPPTSFSFSKKKKALSGIDVLLQPPKAKFLMGREPRESTDVIATTINTVSSSPPPQHVESTSVACVKRESVSSRTMALAATAMLGIAAIGSFWTHFPQHSAVLSSHAIEKPVTDLHTTFLSVQEEEVFEEISVFQEKSEEESTIPLTNVSFQELTLSEEEESFFDKKPLFEDISTITKECSENTKQLVVYKSPAEYFNYIMAQDDYSNKMLWRPLPSPYKMNVLLSKRYDFDNTFIFEETRSIRVSMKNQDTAEKPIIIEGPQHHTQEGDLIVRYRDATLKARCRLVETFDLRGLPMTRKTQESDIMVQKIMRGHSIVRRALVASLHLENAVIEYRGLLAYENELANMRAAREEKKRKEEERIRRKLDNFAMLKESIDQEEKESIEEWIEKESIEELIEEWIEEESIDQDKKESIDQDKKDEKESIVSEKKHVGSSLFRLTDLFACLLSSMLGFGVVALGMNVAVWMKKILNDEIVMEEDMDAMFDCEDETLEIKQVTSHRQSHPVILPGIQDIPSQSRYNFRPRTPIDYSERRRKRRTYQAEETPKRAMSHITLPLSAFGRLEQNRMMTNISIDSHTTTSVLAEKIPPQTARPRCAKRRLAEISSESTATTTSATTTPQLRRSARLAKRRRRVLQTPLMFSQQTPSSSFSTIPTPLPFSVNTPRLSS